MAPCFVYAPSHQIIQPIIKIILMIGFQITVAKKMYPLETCTVTVCSQLLNGCISSLLLCARVNFLNWSFGLFIWTEYYIVWYTIKQLTGVKDDSCDRILQSKWLKRSTKIMINVFIKPLIILFCNSTLESSIQ